jgi:hypothetical protein
MIIKFWFFQAYAVRILNHLTFKYFEILRLIHEVKVRNKKQTNQDTRKSSCMPRVYLRW